MKKLLLLTTALYFGFVAQGSAHFLSAAMPVVTPPGNPPTNLAIPQISGTDFPTGGSTTTLTAVQGTWTNSPTSYSYKWQLPDGTSLGTGTTVTLTPSSMLGKVIELVETATNSNGSASAKSYWFGPMETSAPTAIPAYELAPYNNVGPTTIATETGNFLQNTHAIMPGCSIPPPSPTHTASGDPNVWYFDPNGKTYNAWVGQGVSNPGHTRAQALSDITAILNPVSGYPGTMGLFGASAVNPSGVIRPGDTIYIEPGFNSVSTAAATISGPLILLGGSSSTAYSTSDGTTSGTVIWTWVLPDPSSTTPVLFNINMGNGNGGAAGWIFKNINLENYRQFAVVLGSAGSANDTHDMIFEGMSITGQLGHSGDPWPAHYPSSGGTSDGTVMTATPTYAPQIGVPGSTAAEQEISNTLSATAAAGATTLYTTGIPLGEHGLAIGQYVWTQGYYLPPAGNSFTPAVTNGIPAGTKVATVNGLTAGTYVAGVNAAFASSLTSLPANPTNPISSTSGLPTSNDGHYWTVASSNTAVQTVYAWNAGSSAYTSLGTIPPVTTPAVTTATYNYSTPAVGVVAWNGSTWADLGPPYITIAPCDKSADAPTGCPTTNYPGLTTNIPGCDPIYSTVATNGAVTQSGGCSSGLVPWNGLTTSLASGFVVEYTTNLTILPAGYWNHVDFSSGGAFGFNGRNQTSGQNIFYGVSCLSIKDSTTMDEANHIAFSFVHDVIIYNNRGKFASGDWADPYSDNRIFFVRNYYSDPTITWLHQDGIQWANSGSNGTIYWLYNDQAVDNEFFQTTDPTNPFPRYMQTITTTDNSYWQMYVADNIVDGTTNPIAATGKYSAVIQNSDVTTGIQVGYQTKAPQDTSQTFNMNANNIGPSMLIQVTPRSGIPVIGDGTCNATTGNNTVIAGNISIPVLNSSGASGQGISLTCFLPANIPPQATGVASIGTGTSYGVNSWSITDYRSDVAGVTPLFTSYHPLDPTTVPWAINSLNLPTFAQCVNGTIVHNQGTCNDPDGKIDLRPNPSFVGSTGQMLIYKFPTNAPATPPNLTYILGSLSTAFGGESYPPGIYQYNPTASGPDCGSAAIPPCQYPTGKPIAGYFFLGNNGAPGATWTPGIIGAGVWQGAQEPFVDHDGRYWDNPPSAGAYEGGP